jgi:1,4-dihydroxy-2-naphthoate octaprenyltransferase
MSKKKKQTAVGTFLSRLQSIEVWIHNNQNWVYIAIIGFCLSVTILYRLGQLYGWWA